MSIDLTRLHAALAAHTAQTQELLDSNAAHATAAATALADAAAAEQALDALAAEVEAQTATLAAFNTANAVPPAA